MARVKASKYQSKSKELFWGKELEYVMPKQTFDNLIQNKDCKGDKVQFVIDYVNQAYGLMGHVTSLVVENVDITISPILME